MSSVAQFSVINGFPTHGHKRLPNTLTALDLENKLIMDGTYGVNATHFTIPEIDIYSNHYYPLDVAKLQGDLVSVATAGRTYFAGEFDWTGLEGGSTPKGSTPEAFYAVIENAMKRGKDSVIAGDVSVVRALPSLIRLLQQHG